MGELGKIHLVRQSGEGAPVVLLHGAGQSGATTLNQVAGILEGREIWALDLPGHGASDKLPDGAEISTEAIARFIASALKSGGIEELEILATGLGAAVGAKLTEQFDVRSTRVLDPLPYSDAEQEAAREGGLPDLSPRLDGTHVVAAWSYARSGRIAWPTWDMRASAHRAIPLDTEPQNIHDECADMLRLGSDWRTLMELEIALDWSSLLAAKNVEPIVSARHPCPDRLPT